MSQSEYVTIPVFARMIGEPIQTTRRMVTEKNVVAWQLVGKVYGIRREVAVAFAESYLATKAEKLELAKAAIGSAS